MVIPRWRKQTIKFEDCESEGYDHVAETWKLIREVVRDVQQSNIATERYNRALNKGVFLSE